MIESAESADFTSGDLPPEAPPNRGRRLLGGLAVAGYLTLWIAARHWAATGFGPVFANLADSAFLLPIAVLIWKLGPAIGHRRNAWWLLLVPLFNIMVAAGVIYRVAGLPYRPWAGTVLPRKWTVGFRIAVAAGILITVAALGFSLAQQQWPVERSLDGAVAKKLAVSNRSLLPGTNRVLMVFDRGEEAVALVETSVAGERPRFRAWWFRPDRSWWRTGWRLVDDSAAGSSYVLGEPRCADDFYDWCRVGLPQEATGFLITFENGRTATGTAAGGLGVAFVRPSAPPVRVVAYDHLGQEIADYPVAGYPPGSQG